VGRFGEQRASSKEVNTVWAKRAKDLLAAFILGNGVLDLIAPHERYSMWQVGPEGLRKASLWLAKHPTATRLRGIVRVGIGLWLGLRQYRQAPQHWYQRWFSQYRLGGWLAPLGFVLAILLLLAAAIYGRSRSKTARKKGKFVPTIARITELSATSEESFEDAINRGIKRATSTLRNVESAWIKDMNVMIENNEVAAYKVNMAITFVLEEGERPG
jgi:flavin-binding protein dodecin